MGVEYAGRWPSGRGELNAQKLFERLCSSGEWVVHERSGERLSVRYAGQPEQPRWPEDAVIEARPTGVHVLFHSGTAAQRQRLLGAMKSAMEQQGFEVP